MRFVDVPEAFCFKRVGKGRGPVDGAANGRRRRRLEDAHRASGLGTVLARRVSQRSAFAAPHAGPRVTATQRMTIRRGAVSPKAPSPCTNNLLIKWTSSEFLKKVTDSSQ